LILNKTKTKRIHKQNNTSALMAQSCTKICTTDSTLQFYCTMMPLLEEHFHLGYFVVRFSRSLQKLKWNMFTCQQV